MMDRETAREWLNLELDGRLGAGERARLDEALAADAGLAAERRELMRMESVLQAGHIEVDDRFRERVMRSLPAAGWEARHPQSWRLAIALLLVLGGLSAVLVGVGSAHLAPVSPLLGAAAAVVDLFAATALAGAGLLAASWKGLGLALGELLAGSLAGLAVFAIFVLSLNLVFLGLLRGARPAAAAVRRHRDESS